MKQVVGRGMAYLSLLFKLLRHRPSVARAKAAGQKRRSAFYRSAWEQAAADTGASVRRLSGSLLAIGDGDFELRVADHVTPLDDPVTLKIAGDKPLVHRLLGRRGLPVPEHVVCKAGDVSAAWEFIARAGAPCVIKPARSTGAGDGVTAGVTTGWNLVRAMALAGAHADEVVIEKQLSGRNYRLLYLDGELLDVVRRDPPTVVGDGRSTVRRLVHQDNQERLQAGVRASQTLLAIDWEVRDTVRRQGFSLRSVPPAGERVQLKTVVSDNRSRDNHSATHEVCRAVVEAGAEAAAAVGTRLAGVDIVTSDPSRPLEECGGAVIEVNTTPGYYVHHMTATEGVPVCTLILRRLLEDRRRSVAAREGGPAAETEAGPAAGAR